MANLGFSRHRSADYSKLGSNGSSASSTRRGRRPFWQILGLVVLALILLQSAVILVGLTLIYNRCENGRIGYVAPTFPSIPYVHINTTEPLQLKKGAHLLHVAKEFGVLSMGGLGQVLTALAVEQQRAGQVDVSVVLPFYSLLREMDGAEEIKPFAKLSIGVYPNNGYSGDWSGEMSKTAAAQALQRASNPDAQPERAMQRVNFQVYTMQHRNGQGSHATMVTMYLIGPGDVYPFDSAFIAHDVRKIYDSPGGLPHQWRDLYFAKAVAQLIEHLNHPATSPPLPTQDDGMSLQRHNHRRADVVHMHGATIGMLGYFLLQRARAGAFAESGRPALVYTLHDYSDEVLYQNAAASVDKFLDFPTAQRLQMYQYRYNGEVFISPVGIDYADMVTLVSRSLTADLVEGRLDFSMSAVAMNPLRRKASRRRFVGITNGIDLAARSPFSDLKLATHHLTFPRRHDSWPFSTATPTARIRDRKRAAKDYLYRAGLLPEEDLDRPLMLFIGRFQYNKGLDFFADAAKYIASRNGRFVIMGQPTVDGRWIVTSIEREYPDNVLVISDQEIQGRWGIFLRAAADLVFVPSRRESFGLVAAEGLLFGASVVSTGVGGLAEFLVDRPSATVQASKGGAAAVPSIGVSPTNTSQQQQQQEQITSTPQHNAFLFTLDPNHIKESMQRALSDAFDELDRFRRDSAAHEAHLEHLISTAIALRWEKPGGPVDTYHHVYAKAITLANPLD